MASTSQRSQYESSLLWRVADHNDLENIQCWQEREAEDSRLGLGDRTHRLWRSRRDFHSQPGGSAILLSHFSRVKVLLLSLTSH